MKTEKSELIEWLKEQIEDEQLTLSDMRNEKQDMNSFGAGDSIGRLEAYKSVLSFVTDNII